MLDSESCGVAVEVGGVEVNVSFKEVVDEVPGVVVVLVPVDRVSVSVFVQSLGELAPVQLINELVIGGNIDETWWQGKRSALGVEDLDGGPFGASLGASKVCLQGRNREHLAGSRLANRGQSSHRDEALWLFSSADNGTVASHAEAHDRATLGVDVEVALDEVGELLSHVGVHVEVLVPGGLGSVAVVSSTVASSIVSSSLRAVLIDATGASVWEDHADLTLHASMGISTLGSSVLPVAGKTGEEVDSGVGRSSLVFDLIGRDKDGEGHLTVVAFTPMLDGLNETTSGLLGLDNLDLIGRGSVGELVDGNDTTEASATVHDVNTLLHFIESVVSMSHILIKGKLTKENLVDELGNILTRFPASESCAFPDAPSDELEGSSCELLAGSSDTDDSRLTPSTMGNLEGVTHNLNDTCAVEGEVNAPLLVRLEPVASRGLHRVVAVGSAKIFGDLELVLVDVEGVDARSTAVLGGLDDSKADGAETPDSNRAVVAHLRVVHDGTPTSGNSTAEK